MSLASLATTLDKVEVSSKANADLAHDQQSSIDKLTEQDKASVVMHHYKHTETRTVEEDDTTQTELKDAIKSEDKLKKDKKSRCGCFGRLIARKK